MKDKIYYQLEGKGKPLVFVHGLLGFWRNFQSISKVFSQKYSCLLYDQRGHGRSFHKRPYTVKQMSEDLKKLCDFFSWDKIFLVGHSLGGYVSLCLAQNYPDLVKKMVIVDASPWPKEETGQKIADLISSLPTYFLSRVQAVDFFKTSVENGSLSKTMSGFLMASLKQKPDGKVEFLFDKEGLLEGLLDVRGQDFTPMVKKLRVPTLFLRGEHSSHFSKSDFNKLLKLNLSIEGREVKDSGHWLHFEQKELFIEILKEFLD